MKNELGEHTYSEPKNRCVANDGSQYNLDVVITMRLCIINIYELGDCIPPHIDSHDVLRSFSIMSFLSECNIIFGHKLEIIRSGKFIGSALIPLPVGSVLVLNGNRADLTKHFIPVVSCKRISITFRKMDKAKRPHNFKLNSVL
ncbi:hypothetical protein IEQ34_003926 [Dendrobium chrysotoxum]|uniref:Fe2OG dioxygenase domain-containing protein n=1 Tax=Dendrobium chrysotoxum TaxID=161865 RepID=A0AAV7HGS1_DENCH|nr:hypothetical protein IEQ34_003926 [Dendrobium chrysotoxum]